MVLVLRALDKNLIKRLFCLLLCILVTLSVILCQYQEAHAVAPLIVAGIELAPEAIAAIASLLCASGVYCSNAQQFNDTAVFTYDHAPSDIKLALAGFNYVRDGVISVSDNVWNWVTNWVHNTFVAGSNSVSIPYNYSKPTWNQYFPISVSSPGVPFFCDSPLICSDGTTFSYTSYATTYKGSPATLYSFVSNGYQKDILGGNDMHFEAVVLQYYPGSNETLVRFYVVNSYSYSYPYGLFDFGVPGDARITNTLTPTVDTSIYNVPTYDFKRTDGTRTVQVKSTSDLVGKTAADVQNPADIPQATTPPVSITPYSNSWSGTFRDCAPTGDYTFAGTGTYTGDMTVNNTGTWEGQWTTTQEGARVWTGTYTAADSKTWTGSATESLSTTASDEIDWEPLKISGYLFTTKFPFSLPWDLLRTFQALVIDDAGPPKWDVKWDDPFLKKNMGFTIDLSQYDNIFKIIKVFVLVAMNVGLIFGTRKLLGGAT